ncbi:peptidoglycan-binding protein [Nostoc sp. CENA67]|uniref:Peptidoglycan-binding protein n=1 Tax=Amazonocrinis nigriterrae CENA67 TaxID=2794033 RepID=A0A8J7HRZ8_9NOST|nr:GH25 family lysozyme [Amazonocrinis nigriterrae]MBH8564836.1 peptidoglycan-binding protein [Amazonocrinis nigriterrae CENA67]
MSVEGIDVAEFSKSIDWNKVKSQGIRFAFARVNYGGNKKDDKFSSYWPAIKAAGIIRGAYLFFRPSEDIQPQVKMFAQDLEIEPGDLPPVVDIEPDYYNHGNTDHWHDLTLAQRLDCIAEILTAVETATGYKPIIYTGPSFWQETLKNTSRFADYDLWIAHYHTDTPSIPGGWKLHTFHQYKGDQTGFPGISGNVDRNRFNGTLDRLKAETVTAVALQEGRIGPKVKKLQQALKKVAQDSGHLEFDPGAVDGMFGSVTKKALIAYQKANSLTADGTIASDNPLLIA